ncbi:MAG TPA: IPT/TIG domain-containing protein, partial [Blastocatellia bacterium]
YLGTDSNPPLIESNDQTINPGAGISQTFTVTGLQPNTTYYWMIVGKTMAQIGVAGPVWSFTTGASTSSSPPTVSSISKDSGPIAGGTSVTISGTGFVSGATVSFGNWPATSVTVSSPTTITATTPSHAAGLFDVTVTNPDTGTGTLPQSFTFIGPASLPQPKANLIAPASGAPAGGTSVIITGSYFQPSATVTIGGVPATSVTVTNGVEITATTPAGALGSANVVVTNPDNQTATLSGAYTYANPAPPPTISSLSATSGPTSGLTAVTITGTGFEYGATVTFGGSPATTMIVYNSTAMTCYTPPGNAGAADVVVTNYDGNTATLSGGFNYFQQPVAISSVSPTSGTSLGGTVITITGTGFAPNAVVTIGSASATQINVPSATTIYATTPPSSAGTVNVTVSVAGQTSTQTATLSGGFTYIQAPPPSISSISPNTGYTGGGNPVTITGSNFAAGAAVTIGGSAATSIVVQSSTSITANTPAHVAATVDVVVTNTDGQSSTLSGGFTYSTSAPPPETVLVVADFNNNALDTTNWQIGSLFSGTTNPNLPVAVANQSLEIGPLYQGTSGSNYNGIVSINHYNFTGAYAYVILDNPAASDTAGDAMLTIGTDANDYYRIYVEAGNLICQRKAGGTKTTLFTQAYNSTNDVYLRIRNDSSAGNAVFEVAPNSSGSPGAWTQIYSEPWNSDVTLTSLLFEMKAGTFQAETNPPGTVAFGNFRAAIPGTTQTLPPPTLSSISPTSGSTAGGTAVTISGSAFQSGLAVTIGGAQATNVTVTSSTTVTATTPAGTAGSANVTVMNPDGQTATLTSAFTYTQAPPPSITSVSPTSGSTSGGTTVTVSGSNFQTGATVMFGTASATSVTVQTSSTISAVTPANQAGTVNVIVTNPGGQSATLTSAFTYTQGATAPSITSASPSTGSTSGGTTVTVSGANFQTGATVMFGTASATSVTVQNSTTISAVTPANPAGAVNVVVTNPGGQSATLASGFTYSSSGSGGPTILLNSIDTTNWMAGDLFSGTTDTTVPVSVANQQLSIGPLDENTTGSHYNGLVTAKPYNLTGAYASVQLVTTPASDTAADAMLTIGTSVNNYYRIYYEAGDLICQKKIGGGAKVSMFTGAYSPTADSFMRIRNDVAGGNVIFEVAPNQSGAPGTWTQVYSEAWNSDVSLTSLTFELKAGTYQAETNPPGTVVFGNFLAATSGSQTLPPPSLSSISPNSGSTAGGTSVTISGSAFQSGLSVTIGGSVATGVTVVNSTTITASTPSGSAGTANVTVTNPDGQSATLASAFTYVQPAAGPSISSVSPNTGSTLGGTSVTISGANFQSGASVTFGAAAATGVTVQNSATISAVTPANSAGAVNVTVTNPGGQSATSTSAFTYVQAAPAPSISSVSPNTGSTAGGTSVTISGANFQSGASVTFGSAAATGVTVENSTTISAVTPANSAGAVNVVVTNPDSQSATLSSGFAYSSSSGSGTVLLNSLDTTNWMAGDLFSGTTDKNVPLTVANQQLSIGPLDQNTSGSHYNGLVTVSTYNLTGAYVSVQLATPPASDTAADAMLTIGTSVDNYYRIYYEAGSLICQEKINGGAKVTVYTAAYSAAADSFMRIRNDTAGGNVIFEVAPNQSGSPGTWTEVYSEPWNSAVSLTSLVFELKAGTWQPETNVPGTVVFANFLAAETQ